MPSALGDIPAVPFDLVQLVASLEDVSDISFLVEVPEALDPSALPHFHPGVLWLWMKVEQYTFRSQRTMNLFQGVDHALQFDASQGVGEDGDVIGLLSELGIGNVGYPEADFGTEWLGSALDCPFDLL